MNGLVGYASSDEEDEKVIANDAGQSPAVKTTISTTTPELIQNLPEQSTGIGKLPADTDQNVQGPVFGPTAPISNEGYHNSNEDASLDIEDMAEQDILRYLTSASHPMEAIPASPPGSPDRGTATKFARFLDLKSKDVHFNEDLASKNGFRNPALMANLVNRFGLEGHAQYANSLPTAVFDSSSFPAFAFKESLLENQKALRASEEAQKKTQSVAGKRTINFESGGKSQISSRTSTPGLQHNSTRSKV